MWIRNRPLQYLVRLIKVTCGNETTFKQMNSLEARKFADVNRAGVSFQERFSSPQLPLLARRQLDERSQRRDSVARALPFILPIQSRWRLPRQYALGPRRQRRPRALARAADRHRADAELARSRRHLVRLRRQ